MRQRLLTDAQYQAILEHQLGVCAICGEPETVKLNGRLKPLAVDHDHATGVVRGLLCAGCNVGIGYLKDDPKRLGRAIRYLRNHAAYLEDAYTNMGPEQPRKPNPRLPDPARTLAELQHFTAHAQRIQPRFTRQRQPHAKHKPHAGNTPA